jgi:two-component system sensor histidine kinase EvgS
LLRLQLQSFDLEVLEAENGLVAFGLWEKGNLALIMTDIQMPLLNGYELTRKIRDLEKTRNLSPIPIVAWTGNLSPSIMAEAHAKGMSDILGKKVDLVSLKKLLRKRLPQYTFTVKNEMTNTLAIDNPKHNGLFDPSILAKNFERVADQWETLNEYARQSQKDLETIDLAFSKNDFHLASNVCYKLLGAARTLGSTSIIEGCNQLEKFLIHRDLSHAIEAKISIEEWLLELEIYLAGSKP